MSQNSLSEFFLNRCRLLVYYRESRSCHVLSSTDQPITWDLSNATPLLPGVIWEDGFLQLGKVVNGSGKCILDHPPSELRQWSEQRSVLRIRDILVRIRIQGSVPLTNGSGSGSCYYWPSRRQEKTIFSKFFAHYFLKAHYIIFLR